MQTYWMATGNLLDYLGSFSKGFEPKMSILGRKKYCWKADWTDNSLFSHIILETFSIIFIYCSDDQLHWTFTCCWAFVFFVEEFSSLRCYEIQNFSRLVLWFNVLTLLNLLEKKTCCITKWEKVPDWFFLNTDAVE